VNKLHSRHFPISSGSQARRRTSCIIYIVNGNTSQPGFEPGTFRMRGGLPDHSATAAVQRRVMKSPPPSHFFDFLSVKSRFGHPLDYIVMNPPKYSLKHVYRAIEPTKWYSNLTWYLSMPGIFGQKDLIFAKFMFIWFCSKRFAWNERSEFTSNPSTLCKIPRHTISHVP